MKIDNKLKEIAKEWDAIAVERFKQLNDAQDQSYENILKPNLIKRLLKYNLENVLDVGCGVGTLTKEIAKYAKAVTGIDISGESIKIAQQANGAGNVNYLTGAIGNLKASKPFTTIYANMVFMDMPEIDTAINNLKKIAENKCHILITITHPAYWPIYWEYYTQPAFSYLKETEIKTEFKTRFKNYPGFDTHHYHRPINYYLNKFLEAGYSLSEFAELEENMPDKWYPRFLLFDFVMDNTNIL